MPRRCLAVPAQGCGDIAVHRLTVAQEIGVDDLALGMASFGGASKPGGGSCDVAGLVGLPARQREAALKLARWCSRFRDARLMESPKFQFLNGSRTMNRGFRGGETPAATEARRAERTVAHGVSHGCCVAWDFKPRRGDQKSATLGLVFLGKRRLFCPPLVF